MGIPSSDCLSTWDAYNRSESDTEVDDLRNICPCTIDSRSEDDQ